MRKLIGTRILCLLILAVSAFMIVNPVMAKRISDPQPLIVICIDSLTLQDITGDRLPQLKHMFFQGAVALMNTNVAGTANLDSSYLTLGTGVRAKAVEVQPGYLAEDDFPTEAGTVAEVQQRRTGNSTGAVLQPGIAALVASNNGLGYIVQPGVLGSALREAGYTTAVIGCADTDIPERPLVNFLMDTNGSVSFGYIGEDLFAKDQNAPFGFWTSNEAVLSEIRRHKESANVIAIEWADLYRVEKYALYCKPTQAIKMREAALDRLNQFLDGLWAEFGPEEYTMAVMSPFPGMDGLVRRQQLTPLGIWGPGIKRGYIISPTTRRPGLIANIDIEASILTYFRLPIPNAIIGRPVTIGSTEENMIVTLKQLEQRATSNYVQRPLVLRLFVLYWIATLALSILAALLRNRMLGCIVHRLLLAGVVLPLAFLVLPLLPSLPLAATIAAVVFLALLPATVCFKLVPSHQMLLITAMVTLFVLVIDMFFAQYLVSSSLLGYCFISGARYYGLGNEYMGIFIGALLTVAGSIFEHFRFRPDQARSVMLVVAIAGSYFLGSSQLGANAGGTLAFAGGAWMAYLWLDPSKLQWRKITRSLMIGVAVLLMVVVTDFRLSNSSSHIGRALGLTAQLGLQVVLGILQRKANMNLKLLRYSQWSRVLLMLIMAFCAVFFGPYRHRLQLQRKYPLLTACLRGALVAAILALIANDSGVVAAATALLYPTALLILLVLSFNNNNGALISNK